MASIVQTYTVVDWYTVVAPPRSYSVLVELVGPGGKGNDGSSATYGGGGGGAGAYAYKNILITAGNSYTFFVGYRAAGTMYPTFWGTYPGYVFAAGAGGDAGPTVQGGAAGVGLGAYQLAQPGLKGTDGSTSDDTGRTGGHTGYYTLQGVELPGNNGVGGLGGSRTGTAGAEGYTGWARLTWTTTDPQENGNIAFTLANPTLNASGKFGLQGSIAATLPAPSVVALGKIGRQGFASFTLPVPTIAAAGAHKFTGTASLTLPSPSVAATGKAGIQGAVAFALPAPQIAATGTNTGVQRVTGAASMTLANPNIAAIGKVGVRGSAAFTLPVPMIAATGTEIQSINGIVALTLANPIITAIAHTSKIDTGNISFRLRQPIVAITGTATINNGMDEITDPSLAIQAAIYTRLTTSNAVATAFAASHSTVNIYDRVVNPKFPFIKIGEDALTDGEPFYGSELSVVTCTIHVFSRPTLQNGAPDPGVGKVELKRIIGAVRGALRNYIPVTGFEVVEWEFGELHSMTDPDGITEHAVLTVDYTLSPLD